MCTFDTKLENINSVAGYKVVTVDKYGHYYSPTTGMRYKVGKIGKIKGYGAYAKNSALYFTDILNPIDRNYNSLYVGKTAIFAEYNDAERFLNFCNTWCCMPRPKFAIIKMELSGELYKGEYYNGDVYIGSEIKSIKKIKQ